MMFWGADTAQLSKRATATHGGAARLETLLGTIDRKSTRLNSSH